MQGMACSACCRAQMACGQAGDFLRLLIIRLQRGERGTWTSTLNLTLDVHCTLAVHTHDGPQKPVTGHLQWHAQHQRCITASVSLLLALLLQTASCCAHLVEVC